MSFKCFCDSYSKYGARTGRNDVNAGVPTEPLVQCLPFFSMISRPKVGNYPPTAGQLTSLVTVNAQERSEEGKRDVRWNKVKM
jgi:hypothetical protein